MSITRVENIKNMNCKRGGIIPYTNDTEKFYFCLGRDQKTNDLTDFGGGIHYNKETLIKGAIREFMEESLSVFEFPNISESIAIYDEEALIIFVYYPVHPEEINYKFKTKVKKQINPEVSEIIWFNDEEFVNLIEKRNDKEKLYDKVELLFKNNLSFLNTLKKNLKYTQSVSLKPKHYFL